ncbi:MAG: outer membrane beta-barrel protein [Bacteroidales bacterium]|nr:outer membrane beta-barrel protein [Bacteroidales bacterium]MCF8337194.1 outer membrane beta-barrel protein [Bacteroidales bacterium]
MNNFIRYISLFLLISLFSAGKAQEAAYYEPKKETGDWSVGAFTGITHFYGDVSDKGPFKKFAEDNETTVHFGIGFGKKINPWLKLRGQFFNSRLNSYKQGEQDKLHMEAIYSAFGIHGLVYLNSLLWEDYGETRKTQLYGFGGLSFASWNPSLDLLNNDTIPLGGEANSGVAFDIGGGVEYQLHPNWNAFAEVSSRFVPSDDLDLKPGNFQSDVPVSLSFGINYNFGIQKEEKSKPDLEQEKEEPREDEKKIASGTDEEDYRRLPGEGPDILDFPMSGCTVDKQQIQSASTQGSGNSSQGIQRDTQQQSGTSKTSPEFGQGVIFSVQILATSKPANISQLKNKYNLNQNIREYHSGGIYRYVVGQFRHYEEAVAHSLKMQSKGAEGAFVVVFRDGEKIKLTRELKER